MGFLWVYCAQRDLFGEPETHSGNNEQMKLVTGRAWRGTAFGGVKGRTELPGIVEGQIPIHCYATLRTSFYYLQGKVNVDKYVMYEFKFADVNKGFDAMHIRLDVLS
ncbi:hypothetical protein BGW80DRAFT_1285737 [Lactifluus volemus]|nr:hypothetical protein BGW80DRAFT_1285737 [Lactifluus volemus]